MASSKERERQLARERYERRQQRQQEHRQRTRRGGVIAATVVAVLAVIGAVAFLAASSGNGSSPSTASKTAGATSTPGSGSSSAAAASGTCTYNRTGNAARNVGVPPSTPIRQVVGARIQLNSGLVQATLDGVKAPCTVNSFVYLAGKGYFDGVPCHRLTTKGIYVLQCGDPTGSGSGGPGYQFGDENLDAFGGKPNAQTTYPAGTLAMANAGAGTNGSQFFIVYKDSPLAASYTPFGKIVKGLDVVTKIAAAGTDNSNGPGDGKPKEKTTMQSVTILR